MQNTHVFILGIYLGAVLVRLIAKGLAVRRDRELDVCVSHSNGKLGSRVGRCLHHCPATARFDASYLHSLSKTVADTAVFHVR